MRARRHLPHRSGSTAPTKLAVVVLLALAAGPAHAQSAVAEALFNDGDRMMKQGRFAQACEAFAASNRAEPRAGTLIRLGQCREETRQLASAWSAYKDALARVKDPRKRELAAARVAALAPRLSHLTIVVVPERRVEGLALTLDGNPLDPAVWNQPMPVDGGDHVIVGRAPGRAEWQTTTRVPIEAGKVKVDVPRLDEAPPAPGPVAGVREDAVRAPGGFTLTTRRKLALGVAGVGVIGVVAGIVLGVSANGKQSDAFEQCPDPAMPCKQAEQAALLIKAAQRRALAANVTFGIAAAALVGAGVLWFTGVSAEAEHATTVRVAPSVAPGQAGVVVMGRF